MVNKVTSYSDKDGGSGNVVNEVELEYNGFGQLSSDEQAHTGTVGSAPKVSYNYADGSANTIRRTETVYPYSSGTHKVEYDYASDTDADKLSRVFKLKFKNTLIAQYKYLGLGSVVDVDYSEPGVGFTLINVNGDRYANLDQFGRVIKAPWTKTTSGDLAYLEYGYDDAGNRTYRKDTKADTAFDELYDYDGVYRLTDSDRGTLNSSRDQISSLKLAHDWGLDPTGNWSTFSIDDTVDNNNDLTQGRTHNKANEIEKIDNSEDHVQHDAAGNMIKAPKPASWSAHYDLTYDAWNRLVKVEQDDGEGGSETVAEYAYDGLDRRTVKKPYSGGTLQETRHLYYSNAWQVLEERVDGEASTDVDRQYVWGVRYIDELILRDRNDTGTLDERLYALQDANWNVVALTNTSGTVRERYAYEPYGVCLVLDKDFGVKSGGTGYDWEYLFTGRRLDQETGIYYYRARYYHAGLGRFVSRDPIGYEAGEINLYRYLGNGPTNLTDPTGLAPPMNWGHEGARARSEFEAAHDAMRRVSPRGRRPSLGETEPAPTSPGTLSWRFVGGMGTLEGQLGPADEETYGKASSEFLLEFLPDRAAFAAGKSKTCCREVRFIQIYYMTSTALVNLGMVNRAWTIEGDPYYEGGIDRDPRTGQSSSLNDTPYFGKWGLGPFPSGRSLSYDFETCAVCSRSAHKDGITGIGDVFGCVRWGTSYLIDGPTGNKRVRSWRRYVGDVVGGVLWGNAMRVVIIDRTHPRTGEHERFQLGALSGRKAYPFFGIADPPSPNMIRFLDRYFPRNTGPKVLF